MARGEEELHARPGACASGSARMMDLGNDRLTYIQSEAPNVATTQGEEELQAHPEACVSESARTVNLGNDRLAYIPPNSEEGG